MKKRDLERLEAGLNSVRKLRGITSKNKSALFTYALVKNTEIIRIEIKAILAVFEPSEAFKEYDDKRIELCKKYADKDEKGEPIKVPIEEGSNIVRFIMSTENKELFDAELKILNECNKYNIDTRNEEVESFNKILDTEADIKLEQVSMADVPADISGEELENIKEMIKDLQPEEEEIKVS